MQYLTLTPAEIREGKMSQWVSKLTAQSQQKLKSTHDKYKLQRLPEQSLPQPQLISVTCISCDDFGVRGKSHAKRWIYHLNSLSLFPSQTQKSVTLAQKSRVKGISSSNLFFSVSFAFTYLVFI